MFRARTSRMMHRLRKSLINNRFVSIVCLLCNATVHVVVVVKVSPKRARFALRAHLKHAHARLCRRHHHLYCYNTKYFAAFFPCACRLHVCLSAELERALLVPHLRLIPELRPRHAPLASRLPSSVRRLFAEHKCSVPVHARAHASDARHAHGVPREGDLQTPEPQLEVVFLAARAVRVAGVARRGEFRHCSWCVACGVLGRRCARRRAALNEAS